MRSFTRFSRFSRAAFCAGAVLLSACTGALSDSEAGGAGGGPSRGGGGLPYVAPEPAPAALQARTWKLTHQQYRRSIEALLGVEVPLVDADGAPLLEPELDSGVFRNMALSSFVSVPLAADYHALAERVVDGLSGEQLTALIPCGAIDPECRDDFLRKAISGAFRRPATDDDVSAYAELFDGAHAHAALLGDPALGFRAVLRALLTSPYFLYRTEIGEDPEEREFTLTDFDVASFLAYSVLDEPPDGELLAAAERGELTSPGALEDVVGGLLRRPEAAAQLREFLLEWLEVVHFEDPESVRKDLPTFEAVRRAMWQETLAFLERHGGMSGGLTELLTTPLTLPEGPLGEFYRSGIAGEDVPPARMGVLALGTVMATNAKEGATSPTLRGLFLRDRLLCQDFVVPPDVPDISQALEREQPRTTRELYELHASDPACARCHRLIDGVGITFENLDEVGRFRTAQNGVPIDTSGKLLDTDVDRELADHTELAAALAQSEWVRECFSRQAFRFYFGLATSAERTSGGTRERENRGLPPIQAARSALAQSGRLADVLTALLTSPSTLERTRYEPDSDHP